MRGRLDIALQYAPVFLYTHFVCGGGLPELRHDWFVPRTRLDFLATELARLAWQPFGIGAAWPYPTDYLFSMLSGFLALIGGPWLALTVVVALGATLCAWAAGELSRAVGGDRIVATASWFALFNPWVYTKTVAGHLVMIWAYAALMGLIAWCLRGEKKPWLASGLICVSAAQIQFFLPALALAAWAATRLTPIPLATAIVVFAPSILGLIALRHVLIAIPYNLDWQASQSVPPIDAAALVGYFANYTALFPAVAVDAVWSFLALAVVGVTVAARRIKVLGLVLLGIGSWLWSTGSKGPISGVYQALIVRLPELEVYRELYDLLGLLAISYIGLSAIAMKRFRLLEAAGYVPGVILLAVWILSPPSRWWVWSREIPTSVPNAAPMTRLALLPPIQPLSFDGRGSGLDPDAAPQWGGVESVNTFMVSFPETPALLSYARHGDASGLRALGVSRIRCRPWLREDAPAISGQAVIGGVETACTSRADRDLYSATLASVIEPIRVSPVPPKLGSGEIFFGDAAGVAGRAVPSDWWTYVPVTTVATPHSFLNARRGWIDARLAFANFPEMAQGIGGAFTESTLSLQLPPGPQVLAALRGELRTVSGSSIGRGHGDFGWYRLPREARAVRCQGMCEVLAVGSPPKVRSASGGGHISPARFAAPLPWFGRVHVGPSLVPSLLRVATRYDSYWMAWSGGTVLPHVRVETALNGWVLPPHQHDADLLVLEPVTLLQLLLETLGVTWTLIVAFRLIAEKLRC